MLSSYQQNPDFMKDKMEITIETWHKPGRGDIENVSKSKKGERDQRRMGEGRGEYIRHDNKPCRVR